MRSFMLRYLTKSNGLLISDIMAQTPEISARLFVGREPFLAFGKYPAISDCIDEGRAPGVPRKEGMVTYMMWVMQVACAIWMTYDLFWR